MFHGWYFGGGGGGEVAVTRLEISSQNLIMTLALVVQKKFPKKKNRIPRKITFRLPITGKNKGKEKRKEGKKKRRKGRKEEQKMKKEKRESGGRKKAQAWD